MMLLNEIAKSYPEHLKGFRQFILREYLQHKLLQITFDSEYASQLCFLGGTCLRIVHGNSRFSEDLDFDNTGLDEPAFTSIAELIKKQFELEGYEVEMKTVFKGAYHCYIRFPELLFKEGLSGYREEKILIQLDTEPQHFEFVPERYILNRFDVFAQINITPLDILLAQKFYAILNRTRNKGRDFFDVIFLLSLVDKPNYDYLRQKMKIGTPEALKEAVLARCAAINMQEMAKDVQPFLFNPADARKVTLFSEIIRQHKL